MPPFHRHPAHPPPVRRHNEPVVVLVTVCAFQREPMLASVEVHEALVSAWEDSGQWRAGVYTILPDHVHLFCSPAVHEPAPVKRWVGFWKRLSGKKAPILHRAFQDDCWDTQMRDRAHYEEKLHYVRMNPVRKGLVKEWQEWPFQGEAHRIVWL